MNSGFSVIKSSLRRNFPDRYAEYVVLLPLRMPLRTRPKRKAEARVETDVSTEAETDVDMQQTQTVTKQKARKVNWNMILEEEETAHLNFEVEDGLAKNMDDEAEVEHYTSINAKAIELELQASKENTTSEMLWASSHTNASVVQEKADNVFDKLALVSKSMEEEKDAYDELAMNAEDGTAEDCMIAEIKMEAELQRKKLKAPADVFIDQRNNLLVDVDDTQGDADFQSKIISDAITGSEQLRPMKIFHSMKEADVAVRVAGAATCNWTLVGGVKATCRTYVCGSKTQSAFRSSVGEFILFVHFIWQLPSTVHAN